MTSHRRARAAQAPRRFPARGLPGARAPVPAGRWAHRGPAGTAAARRARRAAAQQAAPSHRDQRWPAP